MFHRLGDYKHKQRNRLKFLVKSLGWDGFRAEFERELEAFRADGRRRAAVRSRAAAGRGRRRRRAAAPPRVAEILARATSTPRRSARASSRRSSRAANASPQRFTRLVAHERARRRSRPAGRWSWWRRSLGRSRRRRRCVCIGELACGYGDGTVRVTPDQNLVFRWVQEPRRRSRCIGACTPPGCRAAVRARSPTSPAAPAPSRASSRSRSRAASAACSGIGCTRGPTSSPRRRASTSRSAGARTAAASTTSPASGSRAACARLAAAPAPHYFVMVGGGVADGSTTFGRHAATIPARRARRGHGAADRPLPGTAKRRRVAGGVLPPRRPRGGEGQRSRVSTRSIRRRHRRRLHRSGRGPRLPAPTCRKGNAAS